MARYRCPSASFEDIGSAGQGSNSLKNVAGGSSKGKERASAVPVPGPSRKTRKIKDKGKAKGIMKQPIEDKVKEQARTAHKKERVIVRTSAKAIQQTYMYVGNLSPDVTDLQLEQIFKVFGTVRAVTIRSAGGCPRTIRASKAPVKSKRPQYENRMYASISFSHAGAVHRAMELNGTDLNGQKMIIVRDALDLPEFQNLITGYRAPTEPVTPSGSKTPRPAQQVVRTPSPSPEPQPAAGPHQSRLLAQPTNARIAVQFRSRANDNQHAPPTRNPKSTRKR